MVTTPVFTANTIAGSYSVTATSGMLSASFNLSNVAGAAASIEASAGSGQSATDPDGICASAASHGRRTATATPGERGDGDVHGACGTGASGSFAGGANTAVTNAAGQATAGKR